MASIKKAPKKGTRRVQSVKTLDCGRCGLPTTHTLRCREQNLQVYYLW